MAMRRLFCLAALFTLSTAAVMSAQESDAPKETKATSADPLEAFEARQYEGGEGELSLPYRLLKPIGFEAENRDPQQRYPLVVFLHGAGERGDDNERQLIHGGRNFADEAMRRRHPAFVVAPQCPAEKTWSLVRGLALGNKDDARKPVQSVLGLIEQLKQEFPVDENRIYVGGLSMGGFGTWEILKVQPELAAAAFPICGGGDPDAVERFKSTPIWVFHGGADGVVPPERSRDMVDALKAVGGNVIYTEYEGVGHDSWTQTFNNLLMWDWLFAQRKK